MIAVSGPSGEQDQQVIVRVPDGKSHVLVPGANLAVRYLPENPAMVAIDWDRC